MSRIIPLTFLLYLILNYSFTLEVYSEYYILNNDNLTRSFVCLPVEDRSGMLTKLVSVLDSVMKSFNRPEYYQVLRKTLLDLTSTIFAGEPTKKNIYRSFIVETYRAGT